MKGLVHFALLELRRRATAFLPFAILLAGTIFSGCLLCFTIVAISAADADWNVLLLVGAVGLALLVVCGLLLQSGRLNQNERERGELCRRAVGYLPQELGLIPILTARENIHLPQLINGRADKSARPRQHLALSRTDIRAKRSGENYHSGYAR